MDDHQPITPHNFDALPDVHALDEFFHRKYEDIGAGDHHDMRKVATAEDVLADLRRPAGPPIHLPSPSYWPIVVALSFPVIAFGVIVQPALAVVGLLIVAVGCYGWALEPSVEPDHGSPPPIVEGP